MEPRIQHAKTSDGVSIAYALVGNGRYWSLPAALSGASILSSSGGLSSSALYLGAQKGGVPNDECEETYRAIVGTRPCSVRLRG